MKQIENKDSTLLDNQSRKTFQKKLIFDLEPEAWEWSSYTKIQGKKQFREKEQSWATSQRCSKGTRGISQSKPVQKIK